MSNIEVTFNGFIETTQDTLLIFEACRRGILPKVSRRLQEKERKIVTSGSVFVFDERESGIKRWTDGLVWSPSRILGNFLIYRELDKRQRTESDSGDSLHHHISAASTSIDKNRERALVGSLTNSYRFKKNGLIKKTMSIVVNGVSQHMISYYNKEDVLRCALKTPSQDPQLAALEISPEFLSKQNFRIYPTIEGGYDQQQLLQHQEQISTSIIPRGSISSISSAVLAFSPSTATTTSTTTTMNNVHPMSPPQSENQDNLYYDGNSYNDLTSSDLYNSSSTSNGPITPPLSAASPFLSAGGVPNHNGALTNSNMFNPYPPYTSLVKSEGYPSNASMLDPYLYGRQEDNWM
ncbi:5792_t:CDS:2 [Ambispora gerdemannii]|uniref:5792_t:CDS:1 n=1 Tax=Ambispora gerdemannii TaxID=144530 RepID=A0A9N8W9Z9_9GLOM|nr:5792_t:CDS:2 [Ambispora gerdemannii]